MVEESYDLLRFVEYKEFTAWAVKNYRIDKLASKFELNPIGLAIKRVKNGLSINDEVSYKRLTIKMNGEGVKVRDIAKGSEIKTKSQYYVKNGQLAVSKIDARNGAFGVVPEDADGAIITGNFWVYDLRKNIADMTYLLLILATNHFTTAWNICSNGGGNRLYLQESLFLAYKIPLPTLSIQQKIVAQYNHTIAQAVECKRKADELERGIDKLLFDELGIKNIPALSKLSSKGRFFKLVDFEQLIHWNAKKSTLEVKPKDMFVSEIYPNVMLAQYAAINPTTDLSSLCSDDALTFLPMECLSDVYGEIEIRYEGNISKIKGYTRFKNGDVLFAKITPCMQNGKCVVANNLLNGYGYGSTEYHVIRPKSQKIKSEYIHLLLRTTIARTLAQEFFTGSAGQQRVGEDFLENIAVPLPNPEIQLAIAKKINAVKQNIKRLRVQAQALREKAKQDFEAEVFEVVDNEA